MSTPRRTPPALYAARDLERPGRTDSLRRDRGRVAERLNALVLKITRAPGRASQQNVDFLALLSRFRMVERDSSGRALRRRVALKPLESARNR
jgi:hypothetical protein